MQYWFYNRVLIPVLQLNHSGYVLAVGHSRNDQKAYAIR